MINNECDKTVREWNELMRSEKESTEYMSFMFKNATKGTEVDISDDALSGLISNIILLKQIKKLEQQVTNLANIIIDKL